MTKLLDFLVIELFFHAVGWFFRTTGFLGALYLIVAVGVGLFVWAKVVPAIRVRC
jgi:hypothetical protein